MAVKRSRSMSEDMLNNNDKSYTNESTNVMLVTNPTSIQVGQEKSSGTKELPSVAWQYIDKAQDVVLIPSIGHLVRREGDEERQHPRIVLSTQKRRNGKRPRRNAMHFAVVEESTVLYIKRQSRVPPLDCHDITSRFQLLRVRVT
jgi:hypothetical protein